MFGPCAFNIVWRLCCQHVCHVWTVSCAAYTCAALPRLRSRWWCCLPFCVDVMLCIVPVDLLVHLYFGCTEIVFVFWLISFGLVCNLLRYAHPA